MDKLKIASLVIILLSIILGIILYNQFPDKMASHWDANGQVNGYMPKILGVFLVPAIALVMFLILSALPLLDPLKKNYVKFRKYYSGFLLAFVLFMTYVHVLTLIFNLGNEFNLFQLMIPAFSIFIFYLGIVIHNVKRNWFIGIRTPWTISNDVVWAETHKQGAVLFKISAVLALLGLVVPKLAIFLLIVPIIASAIYLVIYSYFKFKSLRKL